MKESLFVRMGNVMHNKEEKTSKQFVSVNAAKRESRSLQMKHDGGLGRGSVQITPHRSKRESIVLDTATLSKIRRG